MPKPPKAYDPEIWHPYCPRCLQGLKKDHVEGGWKLTCPRCVWSHIGAGVIVGKYLVSDVEVVREYGLEPAWQKVREAICP